MKREGGPRSRLLLEYGYGPWRSMSVSFFLLFIIFPFPVCKAYLIGDWLENRRGALNCLVRLFFIFFSVRQ
jgi:hypothetical protein